MLEPGLSGSRTSLDLSGSRILDLSVCEVRIPLPEHRSVLSDSINLKSIFVGVVVVDQRSISDVMVPLGISKHFNIARFTLF